MTVKLSKLEYLYSRQLKSLSKLALERANGLIFQSRNWWCTELQLFEANGCCRKGIEILSLRYMTKHVASCHGAMRKIVVIPLASVLAGMKAYWVVKAGARVEHRNEGLGPRNTL